MLGHLNAKFNFSVQKSIAGLTIGDQDQDVLIRLASCQEKMYDIHHCCVYSEKLLMMDRVIVRNM